MTVYAPKIFKSIIQNENDFIDSFDLKENLD